MKYAIVSDIHANIQAWEAVLEDIQKQGVDAILCLGDVIGYGPNPVEVLESCHKHVDYFILGNHDAVIGNRMDSSLFNDSAKYLIEWTRNQLNDEAAKFFGNMSLRMEGETFACAHAELALPGRFSYLYEPNDCISSFDATRQQVLFVGHTHMQAKFTWKEGRLLQGKSDDFNLDDNARYLINAGSVGDPRDGKTNAHYVIYNEEKKSIQYRSIPFDIYGFKINLAKAKLPVTPFFVMIDEGQMKEAETIKDMEVMEKNQVSSSDTEVTIFNKKEMLETRTRRLTRSISFSPEMMEKIQTHRKKLEEKKQRTKGFEQYQKKKSNSLWITIIILLVVVIITFLIIMSKTTKNSNSINNSTSSEESAINLVDNSTLETPPPQVQDTIAETVGNGKLLVYEGFSDESTNEQDEHLKSFGWEGSWLNLVENKTRTSSLKFDEKELIDSEKLLRSKKHLLIRGPIYDKRSFDKTEESIFASEGLLNERGHVGVDNKSVFISFLVFPINTKDTLEIGFSKRQDDLQNSAWALTFNDVNTSLRVGANSHQIIDTLKNIQFWVIRIDYKKNKDNIKIYLNPTLGKEPQEPTLSLEKTGDLKFKSMYIKGEQKISVRFDEIRVGTSFSAVTPDH